MSDIKIIIPGAAGLVGQNLIIALKQAGYRNLVAIDKHRANLAVLRSLHPDIAIIEADVSAPGPWQEQCRGAEVV
ncbi:MAG: NAD-dependent epimerase/dehydratase family protein, partial [Pseudomonadota bacterium]